VTALFTGLTIFGLVEVVSMLVISTVMRRSGRGEMSFRLLAQAVGFLAAGVGGLAMQLAGVGTVGFSIVTIIALALLLLLVYKVAIPYTHRRWPRPPSENGVRPT
jgi:hypothetical protein